MSYALSKTLSLEVLREFVVGVVAGLRAWPGLGDLAAPWVEMKAEVQNARDARNDARDRELQTTAVVRVYDAVFDRAVSELSGLAFLVSGRNAKAEPYSLLFGTVKAKDIQQLGPGRAVDMGDRLVTKAASFGHDKLAAAAKDLGRATCDLRRAEEEDAQAEVLLLAHNVERVKILRRVEALIAETEAQILTRHPGRSDLVRAILDPSPLRQKAKRKDDSQPQEAAAG